VQVPLGVTEDRLLGSVDVGRSVRAGRPVFQPGLLAEAHRGILYVDELNLLDPALAALLFTVLAAGENRVEREGISFRHPCRPRLIATYNPAEGELRAHWIDRFAIVLDANVELSLPERVEAVDRVLLHAADPVAFGHRFGSGLEALRQRVAAAARRLPAVRLEPEQVRYLVEEAIRAGVEGQRPDLFAVRVARAHAALAGRPAVAAEDLHRAVQLVIVPRAALALPEPPPPPPEAPTEPPAREEPAESEPPEGQEAEKEPPPEGGPLPPDFVFSPEGVVLDPALLAYAARLRRRHGKAGGGALVRSLERGRYVKPVLPLGAIRRLAIDATLRAAAPHQKARRRSAGRGPGRRGRRILLRDEDLRAKLLARKAGSLVIFVVDASGSMALNRMQAAKGAVLALLGEAYRSRDQIALIVFRGERARVLLPPTRSITAASRRLERLPCGGGSPLAHGLVLAVRVGENARRAKDVGEVVIVLITDGKANVPLARSLGESPPQGAPAAGSAAATAAVREELLRIAAAVAALNLRLLVVDTGNPHLSSGLTADLASRAGGTHHRLPRADPHALAALTRGSLEGIPAPPRLRLPHPHDPERGPRSR
jgi:magnesium chelatase subunit D